MIYFDNSASSRFKPSVVKNAVANALDLFFANPGRSGHSAATRGAALVQAAREKTAEFFGAAGYGVIFTPNCSAALNLAIAGGVKYRAHVVTTALEHNSVLRPLYALYSRGAAEFSVASPDETGAVSAKGIERLLRPETAMVVVNHVSNVTGAIADVGKIGRLCRSRGVVLVVDGAQSAGYLDIDMAAQNIDMLAVAPHKGLHAPQGVGALIVRGGVPLRPILFGGTGTDSFDLSNPTTIPEGFEVGTLPTPMIAGLCAALGWARENALVSRRKLAALGERLRVGLGSIKGVRVYSPAAALSGIVAFNVADYDSGYVGDLLNSEYDICVRSGLHCAPNAHKFLGTLDRGVVRVSLGCDNSADEVDYFLRAVAEIAR